MNEFESVKIEPDFIRHTYFIKIADMFVSHYDKDTRDIGLTYKRDRVKYFKTDDDYVIIGLEEIKEDFEDVEVYMETTTTIYTEQRIM